MRKLLCCLAVPVVLSCGEPGPAGPEGPAGPAGPTGEPGKMGDPGTSPSSSAQLSGILPAGVFIERTTIVQIAGSQTHFGKDTTVRFDDSAITVGKLTVGSAGYLQAEVAVGRGARFGAHDVTVDSAAVDPTGQPTGMRETATLKGALTVSGTLSAEATGTTKTVEQGSLCDFNLRNLDRDNPFAGTGRIDGGVRPLLFSALGSRVTGSGLVDALAPAAGLGLHASFDNNGNKLGYALDPGSSNVPQVTARAATALTLGTALTGEKLATPRRSNLYKLSTTADAQVLVLSFATTGGLATNALAGAVAPSSGRFAEGQIFYASQSLGSGAQTGLAYVPLKGDSYVAVLPANLNGGSDWAYDVTARAATAKALSVKEPATPDSAAMPLLDVTLDGAGYASDGALDGPADLDYLRVKTPKAGRLYAQASTPGQSLSPSTVSVTILQSDCTTPLSPQRPLQQEAAVSMDSTYCVVLSSPAGYIGPYSLILTQDL